MRKELEKRLVDFSVEIIRMCKCMGRDVISQNLVIQISKSATSAALNYGEAQGAESKRDFTHKAGIVLKELRETHINLQIIEGAGLMRNAEIMNKLLDESDQLVRIFHKLVFTAKTNTKNQNP